MGGKPGFKGAERSGEGDRGGFKPRDGKPGGFKPRGEGGRPQGEGKPGRDFKSGKPGGKPGGFKPGPKTNRAPGKGRGQREKGRGAVDPRFLRENYFVRISLPARVMRRL